MATNSGNRGNARIWFIGGGVLVALAVVMFFRNYPPAPADAAGTVVGAQRYSSTQITKDDVNVRPNELTTWLQSDTFDKIVRDPKAREIFTSAAFQQLVSDANARHIVTSDASKLLVTSDAVGKFFASEA